MTTAYTVVWTRVTQNRVQRTDSLGSRCAMQVRDRAKRGLSRGRAVEQPRNVLPDGLRIVQRQFGEHVVRMLVIDQRLAMIGFAGLEQLGKTGMGRGQRLGRKHFAKQDAASAELMLLHQHQPVRRLSLARSPGAAWLVVIGKDDAMRHNIPGSR